MLVSELLQVLFHNPASGAFVLFEVAFCTVATKLSADDLHSLVVGPNGVHPACSYHEEEFAELQGWLKGKVPLGYWTAPGRGGAVAVELDELSFDWSV